MNSEFDVILVLGRGISSTGDLPQSARACLQKAAELFRQNLAPRIIVSGKWSRSFDFIPPTTEAQAMKDHAISLGVPPEAISIEDESLDTISNFYYTKTRFLLPNKWTRVLLIVIPELGGRPTYLMNKIFGPDFACDTIDVDFRFPPEKQVEKVKSEQEKLIKLQEFLKEVEDGDHETVFRMHMDYVKKHSK